MFAKLFIFSIAFCIAALTLRSAEAQSFATSGKRTYTREQETVISGRKTSFEENFERFNRDLSDTAERMKFSHALIEAMTSNRFLTESLSNQVDTAAQAQRSFMNSEIHAANSSGRSVLFAEPF